MLRILEKIHLGSGSLYGSKTTWKVGSEYRSGFEKHHSTTNGKGTVALSDIHVEWHHLLLSIHPTWQVGLLVPKEITQYASR